MHAVNAGALCVRRWLTVRAQALRVGSILKPQAGTILRINGEIQCT
jgi:hypothetical protein